MNFSTTSTKAAGYDLGFRCIVILYSDPFWDFFFGDFLDILVASKLREMLITTQVCWDLADVRRAGGVFGLRGRLERKH